MPSTQEPANGLPARRAALIACVLVLVVYFAASSSGGLNAYFTGDDAGNLLHSHKYWEHSLADVHWVLSPRRNPGLPAAGRRVLLHAL